MVSLSMVFGTGTGVRFPGRSDKNIFMEVISKTSDITAPYISIYRNGSVRFSCGAATALNLQEGDTISFCRDEIDERKWYLKRFGGNVELRQVPRRKGLEGCHQKFVRAFLASIGEGLVKVTCKVVTKPNDEGLYALTI